MTAPQLSKSADEDPLGAGTDFTEPNSPLAPYSSRDWHVLAAVLLGLLALRYSFAPLWHTDVWGHLKYAAWMVEHRKLPEREPFCEFADRDTPVVHFAWLGQLVLLGCYRLGEWLAGGDEVRRLAGGVAGLRTLTLVLAVLFLWQLLRAYRWRSGSLSLGVVGLFVYALLLPSVLGRLRPQVFGMVLFAWLLVRLSRPQWTLRDVVFSTLLLVLWVNLHGSFVIGLALLGLFLIGRAITVSYTGGWSLRRFLQDDTARRLSLALLCGLAATALSSPYGPMLFVHVLRHGGHPVIRRFTEFQPLSLGLGPGVLFIYVVAAIVFVVSWVAGRRLPSATEVLLVLVFGLGPIMQRRLLIWWISLVPWLVQPSWLALAHSSGWTWPDGHGIASFRKTIVIGVLVLAILPWTPPVRWLSGGKPTPLSQAVTKVTPWRLAEQLTANLHKGEQLLPPLAEGLKRFYPEGRYRGRVFASETLGDFLLWELPDEYPIVVYTNGHVFGLDHWERCRMVKSGSPGWDRQLIDWGVNLVVIEAERHAGLGKAPRKDSSWSIVVDELRDPTKAPRDCLFIALRNKPL